MRRGTLKDRRSRFTRKEIRSAYIRLMDTMPKEKITVTLLCKEADINRGTFYLHYETIDDVWKDIENELFEEAEKIFEQTVGRQMEIDPVEFVEHEKSTDVWAKVFFSRDISMDLLMRVMEMATGKLGDTIPEGRFSEEEKRVYLNFVIGGCMAVERDRFHHPWQEFQKTNDFYNRLTTTVSGTFAGKLLPKK